MKNSNRPKLGEISGKDKPWELHRAESDKIFEYYLDGGNYPQFADRVNSCSRWLDFQIKGQGLKLERTFFCRVRFCPVCQWRRTLMWKARALQSIPKLLADYPTARFLFLTLTVKNVPMPQLREQIKSLNKGFSLLTRRKEWPGIGHIKALEVTKGNDGPMSTHPHIHVLVMVKSSYFKSSDYVKADRWREMWAECMKLDYNPQIDIKAIKGDVDSAIKEIIKYEAKPDDLVNNGSKWLDGLTLQMKKVRRIELTGIMREYFRALEEEPADLVNADDQGDDQSGNEEDKIRFEWEKSQRAYLLAQEHC